MGCCGGSDSMQDARRDVDTSPLISGRKPISYQSVDTRASVIQILPPSQHSGIPVTIKPLPPSSPQGALGGSVDHVPPIYYVIVGRGPAAVINHATLVQSDFGQARLGTLPVMHIGFQNPWPNYLQHGMGQPPHLLSLPGFDAGNQPTGGPQHDGGLDSTHFGARINDEFERLRALGGVGERGAVSTKAGWVARIQAPGDTSPPPLNNGPAYNFANEVGGTALHTRLADACGLPHANFGNRNPKPYRLIVYVPTADAIETIYADYIDVCTGPGRPTVPPLGGEAAEYTAARTPPWLSPEIWGTGAFAAMNLHQRIILNGVDAIRNEVPWANGERVCVSAGGGVGLNGAEKARNHQAKLDWFGRTSLRDTFNNPRNKTFLWHVLDGRTMTAADPLPDNDTMPGADNDSYLLPTAGNLRYGKGASITGAAVNLATVTVTLGPSGTPQIRDFWGAPHLGLANGAWAVSAAYTEHNGGQPASQDYQRLVVPAGQAAAGLGLAQYLVSHIGGMAAFEVGNRMICLQSGDGRVRVLGAAAQTYPGFAVVPNTPPGTHGDTPQGRMWNYRDQIPVSAVPDGFILSGINIALANQALPANTNVNTMTRAELLTALLPQGDQAQPMRDAIVTARSAQNGFANLIDLRTKAGRDDIPDVFTYGY